jgi:hypothetical protein
MVFAGRRKNKFPQIGRVVVFQRTEKAAKAQLRSIRWK